MRCSVILFSRLTLFNSNGETCSYHLTIANIIYNNRFGNSIFKKRRTYTLMSTKQYFPALNYNNIQFQSIIGQHDSTDCSLIHKYMRF